MTSVTERRQRFWHEQYLYGKRVLPDFLQSAGFPLEWLEGRWVLEVGGGEGGLLNALHEYGCRCIGLEISETRKQCAKELRRYQEVHFVQGDITDRHICSTLGDGRFDLVVMRDVIEHIHDKKRALGNVRRLVNHEGGVFLSFPPRFSPYGGHQQHLSGMLKYIPYLCLLPRRSFARVLFKRKTDSAMIRNMLYIYDEAISIRRFQRLVVECGLSVQSKRCYLIRPSHELRFGLRAYSLPLIQDWPILGEILSTGVVYLLSKQHCQSC